MEEKYCIRSFPNLVVTTEPRKLKKRKIFSHLKPRLINYVFNRNFASPHLILHVLVIKANLDVIFSKTNNSIIEEHPAEPLNSNSILLPDCFERSHHQPCRCLQLSAEFAGFQLKCYQLNSCIYLASIWL